MQLEFYKYQGTGNDFIMLDNRDKTFKNDTKLIAKLCDRKFGIGADGLILLENPTEAKYDFKMVYFNADGNESTMCGNGGRCIVRFAEQLGVVNNSAFFTAIDGEHQAVITPNEIQLQMKNTATVQQNELGYFIDTGSPHHVEFVENLADFDVYTKGKELRNHAIYSPLKGVNVNFAEIKEGKAYLRTYERGVEDETLSCGTGATAVALVSYLVNKVATCPVQLVTQGGNLNVKFTKTETGYQDVWLSGAATMVFKGVITC